MIELTCIKVNQGAYLTGGAGGGLPIGVLLSVSLTRGTEPRPFAFSGVILKSPTITIVMPPYKRTMVKYRIAVTAMPTYWLENLFTTLPSSSVSTLSMKRPVTKHITKDMRRDHVDMNMASCTHACGAPFLSVIKSAYIRVVTKRIESIGANASVVFALLMAANSFHFSIGIAPPETSEIVSMADTMK